MQHLICRDAGFVYDPRPLGNKSALGKSGTDHGFQRFPILRPRRRLETVVCPRSIHSKAEVDAVMEQARKAGAVIVKPAHETFWGGYAGYFQDPGQHLWEVAWNPQWVVPK